MSSSSHPAAVGLASPDQLAFRVLATISVCHFLNDTLQSLVPALYPMLKESYQLDFGQIGLITLTFQLTASLLQPVVGLYTDAHPTPFSLPIGMGVSLGGLLLVSGAPTFGILLVSVGLIGVGSSIFHPESSRIARLASGGQHGLAQSLFQVGGNAGSALGPLLAAFIVLPRGQRSVAWFGLVALGAIGLLTRVGLWYAKHPSIRHTATPRPRPVSPHPPRLVARAIAILVALVFSKYVYMVSLSSYYTFYLMDRFGVGVQSAQIHLFAFLGAVAAGTFLGGPVGDRIGRKYVIWASILGVLPFTLALPYANLFWTGILTVIIGFILASAFSAILVFAQELVPGRIGVISGTFFGLAFGIAGIGGALLGQLADLTSIAFVYQLCSYLPAIGLLAAFLPDLDRPRQ